MLIDEKHIDRIGKVIYGCCTYNMHDELAITSDTAVHKFFAEIIAGCIPNKLTRNQWRGKLRYGVIKGMALKARLRRGRSIPCKYYLTVCAIVKNEGQYFEEWIEWHKKQGVEKFYIYDNESEDDTKKVLEPYIKSGLVDYVYWPGKKQQLAVYDDCLDKHRFDSRWMAVIDLDEFIVPLKDKTLVDFLKRFEDFSAVEVNWLVYGSGGAKKKESGCVMERFTHHAVSSHELNRKVKSIVNTRRVYCFIGCHEAARILGDAADSHGDKVTVPFRDRTPQHDVIRINHYAIKSYEEFLQKSMRGRARKTGTRDMAYFERYDLNDTDM